MFLFFFVVINSGWNDSARMFLVGNPSDCMGCPSPAEIDWNIVRFGTEQLANDNCFRTILWVENFKKQVKNNIRYPDYSILVSQPHTD